MIKSGLKVPTPAIPMPDLAVPYAAPAPAHVVNDYSVSYFQLVDSRRTSEDHLLIGVYEHAVHVASCNREGLTAKATPPFATVSIDCRHDFEIRTHHAEKGGKLRGKLVVRHVKQICL